MIVDFITGLVINVKCCISSIRSYFLAGERTPSSRDSDFFAELQMYADDAVLSVIKSYCFPGHKGVMLMLDVLLKSCFDLFSNRSQSVVFLSDYFLFNQKSKEFVSFSKTDICICFHFLHTTYLCFGSSCYHLKKKSYFLWLSDFFKTFLDEGK